MSLRDRSKAEILSAYRVLESQNAIQADQMRILERDLKSARKDTERINKLNSVAWQAAVKVLARKCEDYDDLRCAIDALYPAAMSTEREA